METLNVAISCARRLVTGALIAALLVSFESCFCTTFYCLSEGEELSILCFTSCVQHGKRYGDVQWLEHACQNKVVFLPAVKLVGREELVVIQKTRPMTALT